MDNLEISRQKIIRRILWGGIAVVMILPLVRSVNWEQGILKEWACRVEELSKGTFALFPTSQVYFDSGVRDNALNSNLFFFVLRAFVAAYGESFRFVPRDHGTYPGCNHGICKAVFRCLLWEKGAPGGIFWGIFIRNLPLSLVYGLSSG